jgi:hypothetical protein
VVNDPAEIVLVGVIDPAEIYMTPLKFQIFFSGPQIFLKREYPTKLFHG